MKTEKELEENAHVLVEPSFCVQTAGSRTIILLLTEINRSSILCAKL